MPTDTPPIQINLDACELECLIDMLLHAKDSLVRQLGERMPRPVPPKRRKNLRSVQSAVIERWVYPDVRTYLQDFLFNAGHRMRAGVHDRKTVRLFLAEGIQPGTIVYLAHVEGMSASRALAALPSEARKRFVERQVMLEGLIGVLESQREGKARQGARSIEVAIAKAADRRTRALRDRLETVSRKHEKAQTVVADVAEGFRRQIRDLEKRLEAAQQQISSLSAVNEAQRATIEDLKRQAGAKGLHGRLEGDHALRTALSGLRVLVIGDDNRAVAYREIIEGFGAEFDFISGFSEPPRVVERVGACDVAVLVTSFVSHKVSGHINTSGKPVVWVNNGGEQSMRMAIGQYVLGLLLGGEAAG